MIIVTPPAIEPVTLTEAKGYLRLDSGMFEDEIESNQSIAPADYAISTVTGDGVDVSGKSALVTIVAGAFGVGGTVDAKIQYSEDDITYYDWESFAQITDATDETTYEKEYTGTFQYIRVVAVVAVASCNFGGNVITGSPQGYEDIQIQNMITVARRNVEALTNRVLITQTWDMEMDRFPSIDVIKMPLPPLQSITSINYYDTDGVESTFSNTLYQVDTLSFQGRIGLHDGEEWPTETLRTLNGVIIRFVAGYGSNTTDVPEEFRQAIMMLVGHYYENREITASGRNGVPEYIKQGLMSLIWYDRIVTI